MSECVTTAIQAANRAADMIARRLQYDLDSLTEQLSEISAMMIYDTITDENMLALKELQHKILALNPGRPETLVNGPDFPRLALDALGNFGRTKYHS